MTEPALTVSPFRVLIVGIGLVAVGVVVGAACAIALGMLGVAAISVLTGDLAGGETLAELLAGLSSLVLLFGSIGGVLGAFLAPIVGFSLVRRVALGRAIVWMAGGTLLGGLIGMFLAPFIGGWSLLLLGPLAGLGTAAFRLWAESTELGRRRRKISKGAA